jgi:hypothetical protein
MKVPLKLDYEPGNQVSKDFCGTRTLVVRMQARMRKEA